MPTPSAVEEGGPKKDNNERRQSLSAFMPFFVRDVCRDRRAEIRNRSWSVRRSQHGQDGEGVVSCNRRWSWLESAEVCREAFFSVPRCEKDRNKRCPSAVPVSCFKHSERGVALDLQMAGGTWRFWTVDVSIRLHADRHDSLCRQHLRRCAGRRLQRSSHHNALFSAMVNNKSSPGLGAAYIRSDAVILRSFIPLSHLLCFGLITPFCTLAILMIEPLFF